MYKTMAKRCISVLLIVAVLVAYMPFGVGINDYAYAAEAWDGSVSDPYELEYDEELNAYLISSAADLAGFASLVNDEGETDANAILTNCIDLAQREWIPIGAYDYYVGTFDGAGHTISNLSIFNDGYNEVMGLFGYVSGGEIKNLTVEGELYDWNECALYAGGIAATASNQTFTKVSSYVTVDFSDNNCNMYAGGIVGYATGTVSLTDCANHSNIKAYENAGGLIGCVECNELLINSCYNEGDVSCKLDPSCAGGLIGYGITKALSFDGDCYNEGLIYNGSGYQIFGMVEHEEFSNNCWYLYVTPDHTNYDPFDRFSKYDVVTTVEEFLDDGWNENYALSGEKVLLNWEIARLSHTDESAATDEEIEAAFEALDTYVSVDNYYDEQWTEIQEIIDGVKASVSNNSFTMTKINSLIEEAKSQIDLIKDKAFVDVIKAGKKIVNDKFDSLSSDDYDAEDWSVIETTVAEALSDIDNAEKANIQAIADAAVTYIESVMTKADKAALNESRQNALDEVKSYIQGIEAEWAVDLLLLENNKVAQDALKAKQENISETHFNKYLAGGEEADLVLDISSKTELTNWINDAKAYIDSYKTKGQLVKISTADELRAFATLVNSKDSNNKYSNTDTMAILLNDIDATDKDWTPIGSSTSSPYSGMFFGNGHTIKINSAKTSSTSSGIFGVVAGAYIDGLTAAGTISGSAGSSTSAGAAGIVGYVYSNANFGKDTVIVNCNNEATISGGCNVGGIVGYVKGGSSSAKANLTIDNCQNNGTVTSKASYNGGIVGCVNGNTGNVIIKNCDNYNTVSTDASSGVYMGGILGYTKVAVTIENCSNTANVSVLNPKNSSASKGIGGIVGSLEAVSTITGCENSGTITASQYVAGIVGYVKTNVITITLCSNSGDIIANKGSSSAGNEKYFAGIMGTGLANISYCYNSGNIDASASSDKTAYVCGIAGMMASGYNKNVSVTNVYNTGTFTTNPKQTEVKTAGIICIGNNPTYASLVVDYCYSIEGCSDYVVNTTTAIGENIAFKSSEDLKTEEFLALINQGQSHFVQSQMELNDGYPVFDWQLEKLKAQLEIKKEEAKNDLTSKYKPDNYYSPQKELVVGILEEALSKIQAITNSLSEIGVIKTEYAEKLSAILDKLSVQAALISAKGDAIDALEEYLDFSNYTDATKVELEKLKPMLQTVVDSGKTSINNITPEEYAKDYDLVAKKQAEFQLLIDNLYMSKGIWNGNTVNEEYAPSIEDGSYQIKNGVHLAWFAQQFNNKEKSLVASNADLLGDIDLGYNEWTPIGLTSSNYYNGTFDGNGHTVYGLNVDASDSTKFNSGGLFGEAGTQSVIKNLTVEGKIEGTDEYTWDRTFGGIAGKSQGRIFNCTSKVDIKTGANEDHVGGIVGDARYVAYCTNEGTITAGGTNTGGIAGTIASSGIIYFCANKGNVKGGRNVGGIVGTMNDASYSGSVVSHCYNMGDIGASSVGQYGGIAGYASGINETITNSYNVGKASSGIIGVLGVTGTAGDKQTQHDAVISNTYNAGDVTAAIVMKFYHGNIINSYGLKGTVISNETSSKDFTSISNCLTLEEDVLKGYSSVLGEAFVEDTKNVNNGYPVLTFENDTQEVKEAKLAAIDEITELASKLYLTGKYGTQATILYNAAHDVQSNIANKTTLEDLEKARLEGIETVKAVKTEIQLAQEAAMTNLQSIVDGNVYSVANEEYVIQLLNEANEAIQSCTKLADVGTTEKIYVEELKTISTYQEDTKAELVIEKNKLVDDKQLGLAKQKELESVVHEASKQIDDTLALKQAGELTQETARDEMDDIYSEAKKNMTEVADAEAILPDISLEDEDTLKDKKVEAYEEILENVSAGLENDYREKQWNTIIETLQKASDDISKATTEDAINKVKTEAINAIKDVPTDALMSSDETRLQEKKDSSKNSIIELLEEINLLEKEKQQEALALIETANDNIDKVTLENITLDEAIAKVEELCSKALNDIREILDEIKDNYWTDEPVEPEEIEGVYQITTPEELAYVAALVNSGTGNVNAVLVNDIDLAGKLWEPIGVGYDGGKTYSYKGTFDGAGHTVKNMYVSDDAGPIGLFGKIEGATIKNLTVGGLVTSKGNFSGNYKVYAAGIVGDATDSVISNCVNEATIKSAVDYPKDGSTLNTLNVGGILGIADGETTIEKCINKGKIQAEYCKAIGGIVGEVKASSFGSITITECANLGTITYGERYTQTGTQPYEYGAGGVLGIAGDKKITISYCYNAGTIDGVEYVGGILGYIGNNSNLTVIEKSYNHGKVNAASAYHGALIGTAKSGQFLNNLYMLEGSSNKAIGHIILENDIDKLNSADLASVGTVELLNGNNSIFTTSIANVNGGYPIFVWQLLDSDIKNEINDYLVDYLDKNDFTKEQWKSVEEILTDANEKIIIASESKDVSNAFDEAVLELDAVSSALKDEIANNFDAVSVEGYDEELKDAIKVLVEENKALILDEETSPNEAQNIYDETRAKIVDLVIDEIDEVIVFESEKGIKAAREAYDELNEKQQESVSKYIALVKAESQYTTNSAKADATTELVEKIGVVDKTKGDLIAEARESYDALTKEQKTFVSKETVETLKTAETTYKTDSEAAEKTIKLINVIGNVTKNSEAIIKAARTSYDGLSDMQKTYVSDEQLATLTAAEYKLAALLAEKEPSNSGDNTGTTLGSGIGTLQSGAQASDSSLENNTSKEEAKVEDNNSNDQVIINPNDDTDNSKNSFDFDWTIIPIGLGIIALAAIAYALVAWFGAANKRKKH